MAALYKNKAERVVVEYKKARPGLAIVRLGRHGVVNKDKEKRALMELERARLGLAILCLDLSLENVE